MNLVAYIELIAALACLAGIVFVIWGWSRPGFLPATRILLLVLLTLMMFYGLALFLEWSGLGERFQWHFIEDFASLFIPFIWSFVFYAFVKNAVEAELLASRRHFRNLVESSGDWLWEVDAAGHYTYASPWVQEVLGYAPEEILGKAPFDLMAPDVAARTSAAFLKAVSKGEVIRDLVNINLHKDGHEVTLETNANPVFDKKGTLIGYRGVDRDITARMESERLQKQQQAELDSVFKASPAGIGLMRNRHLIRGNARFFEITGYPEDELVGADPRQLYHSDQDYLAVGEKYTEAMATGFARIETRFIHKDRTMVDVVLYLSPLDRGNEDAGFVLVIQDITALKAARREALAEKTRAQTYLDVVNAMILVLDTDGRVKLINKKGCELIGRRAEQIEGLDWFQSFVPNSYRDISRTAFERILTGDEKSVAYFENPIRTTDGAERLIAWHNAGLRDGSGKIVGAISSGVDITDVHAAQDAARESDERLRVALSAAKMGTWRWQVAVDEDVRDASFNAMLGLPAEETTQSKEDFFKYVHPDDQAGARAECERAIREKSSCEARFRIVRPDGTIRWMLDKGKSFYDFNGQLEYMTGVVLDITERKADEEELRENRDLLKREKELFESMFHTIPDAIYMKDLDCRFTHVNEAYLKLVGFAKEQEVIGKSDFDTHTEEHARAFYEHEKEIMRSGIAQVGFEEKGVWLNGRVGWYLSTKIPLRDVDGNITGLIGISRDITERKQAEQQLRSSEAALQKAQQIARLGFYEWDLRSDVITASERIKSFFGCELDEELTFDLVASRIHPDDRDQFIRANQESRTQGSPFSMDYRVLLPNGTSRWAHDQSEINEDEQGNMVQLFGIIQDITERKEAERHGEELMQRLQFTQFAVDHAGEAAYWMGPDAKFIYVNELACRSLGYTERELLSLTVHDIDPDFPPDAWNKHWVQLRERGMMRFQSHHKTKDGRVFPVEITANYVEYNGVGYNCAFVRDIADRKKAEAALLESEEKYRTIFHSGSQGFFLMTDVFLDCNQQVCDIWGCTRDEVIGHSPVEFSPDLQPDGRTSEEAAKAYIDAAFAGEPQRFYWQHKRKDGTLVDTEITLDLLELKDQPLLQATMIDLSGHETTPPDAG